MDGRELLLLQDVGGDVANRHDQVLRRAAVRAVATLDDGNRMHAEVTMIAAERRRTPLAGGEGGVEGAEIGADDLRVPKHLVEICPDYVTTAGPLA